MYGTGLEMLACKTKCRNEDFSTKMFNPHPHVVYVADRFMAMILVYSYFVWLFAFLPPGCYLAPSSHVGERGGSVVECRTPEREVGGSIPTAAVLCP